MIVFYFTATGNSLSVARHIAASSEGARVVNITEALAEPAAQWHDDVVGIVTPTHTGDMPAPVARFFETADIRAEYLFVVFTCGITPGIASRKVRSRARCRGLQVDYINSIKMVDNNFALYNVRRQIETVGAKDVPAHQAAIAADIAARRTRIAPLTALDWFLGICMEALPAQKKFYRHYHVDTTRCTGCGICAKVCPVDAVVNTADGTPQWNDKCIRCTACYHNCPHQAISHDSVKGGYCQYRNSEVTLADLTKTSK